MRKNILNIINTAGMFALLMAVAACGGGGKAPSQAAKATKDGNLNTLTEIKVEDAGDNTLVQIRAQQPLSPNVFKLTDPLRVIIDFTDTQLGELSSPIPVNNGVVNEISASQFDDVSSSLSRIVIGFDAVVDYQVAPQENMLTITIPKQGAAVAQSAPAEAVPAAGDSGMGMVAAESLNDVLEQIPVEEMSEPAQLATTLNDIRYNVSGEQVDINLLANGSIENYEEFTLDNPRRLVIDLKGLKPTFKGKNNLNVGSPLLASIRAGAHADKIRIVMDFTAGSAPNYQINKKADGLDVIVAAGAIAAAPESVPAYQEPVAEAPAPAAEAPSELLAISELPLDEIPVEGAAPAAAPAPLYTDAPASEESVDAAAPTFSGASYSVVSVDFVQAGNNSRLIVKTSAPASYVTAEEGSDTVILTLNKAIIGKSAARFLNTTAFNTPVAAVVPKQVGGDTRIVATLKESVPYKVTQDGNLLYVDFERTKDFTVAQADSSAPAPEGAEGAAAAPSEVPELATSELGGEAAGETPAVEPKVAAPDAPKDIPALSEDEAFFNNQASLPTPKDEKNKYEYVKEGLLSETMKKQGSGNSIEFGDDMIFEGGGSSKVYTGRKINLDFKEADIRSLFRLFADISKLNIIVGDDVTGKVTIRLRDVPWDQAFAILLQTQSLGAIKYGNIIRVAPADKIQKERELHAQAKKAAIAAAPMDTLFKAVSYANASEVSSHVKNVLSDRGTVNIDARTNTIIVRDVRDKLMEAKTLIEKLDAQTPQVTIEARIVEASDTFVRNWGVQWGASANFSASTGNPTGLLFPNGITAAGSQSVAPVTGGSNPILLNYPATGANASVTLNLGSINNVLDLDLLLGYEESEGNAKLISSPKVTVLDNRPATILSGTKIPYITQTANSGNNVRFESAVISITVTPHITADGSVIMNINASRNEPDFGQSVLGNPTIVQREATTEVLVKSGNTTVIGGIYRINRTRNQSGFPFLRHVPVLGWFFSNDNRRLDRQELLIFVTPRIVGDERTVTRQIQG